MRNSVSTLLFAMWLGLACSDDATEPEPSPTEDELEELFTALCTKRRDCDQNWAPEETIEICTRGDIDAYVDKPSSCLHPVVDYYECAVGLECSTFNLLYPNTPCRDIGATAMQTCPPDTGF